MSKAAGFYSFWRWLRSSVLRSSSDPLKTSQPAAKTGTTTKGEDMTAEHNLTTCGPVPVPDFTRPSRNSTAVQVDGQTLYLPRGITKISDRLWRVTVCSKQQYFSSLEEAWHDLVKRKKSAPRCRTEAQHGPPAKIETGIIGAHLFPYRHANGRYYVQAKVSQSLTYGHRAVSVAHIPEDAVSQEWLDQTLQNLARVRQHYVTLRRENDLCRPVRLEDVPAELVLNKEPYRVVVTQIEHALDDLKERHSHG